MTLKHPRVLPALSEFGILYPITTAPPDLAPAHNLTYQKIVDFGSWWNSVFKCGNCGNCGNCGLIVAFVAFVAFVALWHCGIVVFVVFVDFADYELQFDLARDVGLDYAPRQLFSSSSY
jgi:hypothetical protein